MCLKKQISIFGNLFKDNPYGQNVTIRVELSGDFSDFTIKPAHLRESPL